jgi:isochorismate pyruvate lyase
VEPHRVPVSQRFGKGSFRIKTWVAPKSRSSMTGSTPGRTLASEAGRIGESSRKLKRPGDLDLAAPLSYVGAMPATTISVDDRIAPEACQTMIDVRVGVDALDRALVTLLAERQRYMDAAARIKPARSAVRDEPRVEQVVANVKVAATDAGLSHDIAEPVWRLLIERSIAHELDAFDRRSA